MKLNDIIHRSRPPKPWVEGEKIPWNDPEFSQRMLKEHLSQNHDAASRRIVTIEKQTNWIHNHVLGKKPTRILDLGCGPGLYANRLAALGHECVGIDFSPASIEYARQQAEAQGLTCQYTHQDIRTAEYGTGFGLAMLIYGEMNVFRKEDARHILQKTYQSLDPNGFLLLEPHPFDVVQRMGTSPTRWYSAQQGLFSDKPHIVLIENFWDQDENVAIDRIIVIDAETGKVASHNTCTQAYTLEEFHAILAECGFGEIEIYPGLAGPGSEPNEDFIAILARKA